MQVFPAFSEYLVTHRDILLSVSLTVFGLDGCSPLILYIMIISIINYMYRGTFDTHQTTRFSSINIDVIANTNILENSIENNIFNSQTMK